MKSTVAQIEQFYKLIGFGMDAHYDSQIKANTHTTFSGPARQMGSGGGIGAFAVRMGRVAIPLVRKYILPVAKQVGKNLIESTVPEIGHILAGKKKPSRKLLTNVAKRAAIETVETNLPSGVALRPGGGGGGERKPEPRRSAAKVKDGSTRNVKHSSSDKRKRSNSRSSISKKASAKRSRSDILSEIQFSQ